MVQELPRTRPQGPFPEAAPAAFPVFYRTYSRRGEVVEGQRETWEQVCDRTLAGLVELGRLTPADTALINRMQLQVKALPSGRWLWGLHLYQHQRRGLACLWADDGSGHDGLWHRSDPRTQIH